MQVFLSVGSPRFLLEDMQRVCFGIRCSDPTASPTNALLQPGAVSAKLWSRSLATTHSQPFLHSFSGIPFLKRFYYRKSVQLVNGTQPSTPTHTSSTHPPTMQSDYTPKEFSILSYIDQNSDATQRQLSEHVGVSLGTINILIKRLVKKGLIKIDRLQPNSVKYFLTPAGIASKLERTYGYVVRVYRELLDYQQKITRAVNSLQRRNPGKKICFYGPKDELFQMIDSVLDANNLPADLYKEHSFDSFMQLFPPSDIVLLVWTSEDEALCSQHGYICENLLSVFT